jgi:two-component system nitrogen regulation sensor histidine kinase GlnL
MIMPKIISDEQLLDAVNTAYIFIDTDQSVLHMNSAAELMMGVSRNMAIGKSIHQAFPCCSVIDQQISKALETQRIYSERDLEIQLRPQHRITMDCVITPVYQDDLVTEFIIIELNQVDRRLRISREGHLLSQNEGARDLLRGVAHEIKNPLGGIRGAAQLLAAELQSDEYKEYTDVIINEVDRLQELVDRMLGPRQLPQIDNVNVHEPLEDVRKLIAAEAGPNVRLSTEYDPSLPEVKADRDMLQQAFLNLATNALHAVRDLDDARIMIRTRSERQFTISSMRYRLVLRIEFIDSGPGIPEDMQETVFLPMVTTKAEGTGLGLPIAQSLIQRHGGLVEYDTCNDSSCFIVYLPVEATDANVK